MPRPTNYALRETLRMERSLHMLHNPLISVADVHAHLAAKFNIPLKSVWYYLRINTVGDERIKYTDAERHKLCSMSRKELKAYAEQEGLNFNTLYAMVWRHKSLRTFSAEEQQTYREVCEFRGFMDFTRKQDLQAYNYPGDAFRVARKSVQGVRGLDLLGPNFLIHPIARKFYALSLAEQQALLTNPRRFLQSRAPHISKNWKDGSLTGGYFFILVDTSTETPERGAKVISTHATFDRAAKAAREAMRIRTTTMPEIRRVLGEVRTPTCIRITEGDRMPPEDPSLKDIPDSVLHHMVANLTPGSTWHGHAVAALNRRSGIVETTGPDENPGYEEGWEGMDDD